MGQKLNKKTLDNIIEEMRNVIEKSQDDVFHINEEALQERARLEQELEETRINVKKYVSYVDELSEKVKKFKQRLSIVSKEFNIYSEIDIKKVYEETSSLQTELAIAEQEEKTLRQKRDDLERRIIRLNSTIEHAHNISKKVSVVLNYLYDDFGQVQEELELAQEKQELTLRVIEAQEIERKRLSREIHDGPAQMLANILIRSEIVDLAFREEDINQALKEMESIRENVRISLEEVRRIIYDLRPMSLDDLGLFPVVEKHINTMADYYDVDIKFHVIGKRQRLIPSYEVAIFRIIQEALQNAINHANPKRVSVAIEIKPEQINVLVRDNGDGFDPTEEKKESFGIIGMKERVELINGVFTIDTEKGKGTTIRINLPYNSPVE